MCAIGHYLEHAGLVTTSISLVRENAEDLQPPRTLWVSFPLGRPLGKPSDAAFQHRVIEASLALFARKAGPVLEDFPEDIPPLDVTDAPTCPVSFPADKTTWHGRLSAELGSLASWYDLGRRRRAGRTLVGISGTPVDEIMHRIAADLDEQRLPADLVWFKAAMEDMKAFYIEALTAQPGAFDSSQVYATLWHETQFGEGLRWFYDRFRAHPKLAGYARIVLPRDAVNVNQTSPDGDAE